MRGYFLLFVFFISLMRADYLDVGSSVEKLNKFEYENPNGVRLKIPKETKLFIVSFEKDTGVFVNDYLKIKNPDYLDKNSAVFIADINKMPSIITKMFALPKLRKYKHPIYINYDENFEKVVPSKEDMTTLIFVKESKIQKISYISEQKELKAAIEQ